MVLKIVGVKRVCWGCRLVWSRLVASGAIDPGSNPGSPTSSLFGHCLFFVVGMLGFEPLCLSAQSVIFLRVKSFG
jgi:hypothetical protein